VATETSARTDRWWAPTFGSPRGVYLLATGDASQ
jgi:hypothetical protein